MRGFGRCYTDDKHSFCIGTDCKKKIDYERSFADIVDMVTRIRKKFPAVPLFAVGESLGTCLCIKLAAEHPELVDGLILSGPAVKVNPLMFVHPKVIAAGTVGYFMHPRFQVNTDAFVKYLVSNDESVVGELLADPLCRKGLSFHELMMTKRFVSKTLANAKQIKHDTPILVIQGSEDRCMVPVAVTQLARSIPSSDQTLRWLHLHGHLLLETAYLKASTMEAVTEWMEQHEPGHKQIVKETMEELVQLGAKHSDDDL
jgi:alpha-beta hydrolase superfamily lysophospholipase